MSNLSRRVESLEDGAPGPCPECGHDSEALVRYVIHWEDEQDDLRAALAGDDTGAAIPACATCGNVSTLVVDWDEHSDVPDYPPWNDEGGGGGEL